MKQFNHEDKLAEQILSWEDKDKDQQAKAKEQTVKNDPGQGGKLSKNTEENFSDNPSLGDVHIDESNRLRDNNRQKAAKPRQNHSDDLDLPWTFAMGSGQQGEEIWENLPEEQLADNGEVDSLDSILAGAALNMPQEWIDKQAHQRFKAMNEELVRGDVEDKAKEQVKEIVESQDNAPAQQGPEQVENLPPRNSEANNDGNNIEGKIVEDEQIKPSSEESSADETASPVDSDTIVTVDEAKGKNNDSQLARDLPIDGKVPTDEDGSAIVDFPAKNKVTEESITIEEKVDKEDKEEDEQAELSSHNNLSNEDIAGKGADEQAATEEDLPAFINKEANEAGNKEEIPGGKVIPFIKPEDNTNQTKTRIIKKKVRRPRYKRIFALIFILLLPFLIYFGYLAFNKPFGNLHNDKVINVLLLGVDKRHDDGGRSDTMMVLSLNRETKQLSILSLPRDTRVAIKPGDYEKLNHAYAYGGVKLSQKVVEELLNIPIDYYVEIDLQAFEQFIDDIGGIDINIPKRMYYEDPYDDNGGLIIDFQPGLQHLNGLQAMEYVRYRDEEGDIGRIARQQDFINGVLKKVSSPAMIVELPKIITNIMKETNTNLSSGEIISLLKELPEIKSQGLKTYTLPGKPAYIQGVSYWLPEVKEDRSVVAVLQGLEYKPTKADEDYQNKYNESLPGNMHKLEDGTEVYDDEPAENAGTEAKEQKEVDTKALESQESNSSADEAEHIENKQVENE